MWASEKGERLITHPSSDGPHERRSPLIAISIVSHRQGGLVEKILCDLAALELDGVEVILTLNVPERLPFRPDQFGLPLRIVENTHSRGFGANHNAAFEFSASPYFCVLNPDLRFTENPFPALIKVLNEQDVCAAAPRITDVLGRTEDSARRFPTIGSLARKALHHRIQPDYPITDDLVSPDWIGGMFMLFRSEAYRAAGGFDERYFLYYEDVDICRRLRRANWEIRVVPTVSVIHAARRESHRNPRYMRWHLQSMLRYLWSSWTQRF